MLRTIWSKRRALWQRRAVKSDIDEELRFHLEQRAAENLAAGMVPEEVARAARKRFGNLQTIREECRELRRANLGEETLQDIRFGLRMLRKHPGFAAVAVFSLAVGIGLNSTVFSLINQTSLEELPVHEPDRLFTITGNNDFLSGHSSFAYLDRRDFVEQCPSFGDVMAQAEETIVAHHRELPRNLHARAVSRNYFSFLGLRPAQGRFFLETDSPDMQAEPGVVISYSLWQEDFGGDLGLIGRPLKLDGRTLTVLGVAPKGFVGTLRWTPDDVWIPADIYHASQPKMVTLRSIALFSLIARLRPDVSPEAAQSEARVVAERLRQAYPSSMRTRDARLSPVLEHHGMRYYVAFAGTMLLPGLVLALACANVSGLLIARAQSRTREIAARLVLGSTRSRLVRQLLVESLLLSIAGGAAGLLLSAWAIRALPSLLPPSEYTPFPQLYVDGHLVCFTVVVSALATLVFGLLPAWHATKPELSALLKGDTGLSPAGWRITGLNRIVIGQLAVSLVLLCIAGLFLRSSLRSIYAHPAFQRPDLLLVQLHPRKYGLDLAQIPDYLQRVSERLQALPGVQRVSVVGLVPLEYRSSWNREVFIPREDAPEGRKGQNVHCNPVDERLLDLMGIRLLNGRAFTRADDESSPAVAIVSQTAAQTFWPGQNPLGRVIRLGDASSPPCEVIGVVADGPYNLQDGQPLPYFFFPLRQTKLHNAVTVLVESRVPPRSLFAAARTAIREVDEKILPVGISTMQENARATHAMFGRQLLARFFAVFGVLGLLLALIGLYAVTAYAVGQRTREIGIRMAVGATRGIVLRSVLIAGLRMALIGAALGLPLAFIAAQLLRDGLYGFPPADLVTFTSVPLLLVLVATLACWLPARKATKVDPMTALRYE